MSLLDGLVAHWKMDEESGARYDSHGVRHLLEDEFLLSTGSVSGKFSNALHVIDNDSGNQGGLSANMNVAVPNGWSTCVWMRLSDTWDWNSGSASICELTGLGSSSSLKVVANFNTEEPGLEVMIRVARDGGGTADLIFDISVTPNIWNLAIQIYNPLDEKLYLCLNNTEPIDVKENVIGGFYGTYLELTQISDLQLADVSGINNVDYVDIDSLSIWNRVLTPDERSALWHHGHGLDYPFNVRSKFGMPFVP